MRTFAASLRVGVLVSCFALVDTANSPAQAACADTVPLMTIKIFNRDPNTYIFPVLTMGKDPTGDVWLQACFKVPDNEIGQKNYPRTLAYRIYAFPQGGIKPCKNCRDADSITLTLPLYTKAVTTVIPNQPNQYVDWWKGGTIQLYSNTAPIPPRALREAMEGKNEQKDQVQVLMMPPQGAVLPTCPQCQQPLKFYSDIADLPKSHPSQLIEFTLGARIALPVVDRSKDPPNDLDLENVDFDVSYVNVAYLPAAMGPFMNNQVGYVGTPISVSAFKTDLTNFLNAPQFQGWPKFVTTFADGTKETILKLPSTLEVFSRFGPNIPPPDLEPVNTNANCKDCVWPKKVWKPI
jgi:hypothetical protein